MVRKEKGQKVKRRLVVRDIRTMGPQLSMYYAHTPTIMVFRVLLVWLGVLMGVQDDIVLVDLFGLTPQLPQPLDDYLDDALHFNEVGHDLYAHEVFRALGGVIVGASPLSTEPVAADDNRQDFGYVN